MHAARSLGWRLPAQAVGGGQGCALLSPGLHPAGILATLASLHIRLSLNCDSGRIAEWQKAPPRSRKDAPPARPAHSAPESLRGDLRAGSRLAGSVHFLEGLFTS